MNTQNISKTTEVPSFLDQTTYFRPVRPQQISIGPGTVSMITKDQNIKTTLYTSLYKVEYGETFYGRHTVIRY